MAWFILEFGLQIADVKIDTVIPDMAPRKPTKRTDAETAEPAAVTENNDVSASKKKKKEVVEEPVTREARLPRAAKSKPKPEPEPAPAKAAPKPKATAKKADQAEKKPAGKKGAKKAAEADVEEEDKAEDEEEEVQEKPAKKGRGKTVPKKAGTPESDEGQYY